MTSLLPAVLMATLGTEAQVVTVDLDLLTRSGEKLTRLEVLHSTAPGTGIETALERLAEAGRSGDYPDLELVFTPFTNPTGVPLVDIKTPQDGEDCFRVIYRQVWLAKQEGRRVHLLVAGGRKLVSIYGMLTAQLLFDEQDHLWYLHSSGDFLAAKRLHPDPDDEVELVPIPVILWSHISPAFSRLKHDGDPFAAIKEVEALQILEKMEVCRAFTLGSLTAAEERVVRILVRQGQSDQEIGEQLFISPRTVEQHLRSAYLKAAAHWDLENVSRTQLVSLLNIYYGAEITGKPA